MKTVDFIERTCKLVFKKYIAGQWNQPMYYYNTTLKQKCSSSPRKLEIQHGNFVKMGALHDVSATEWSSLSP